MPKHAGFIAVSFLAVVLVSGAVFAASTQMTALIPPNAPQGWNLPEAPETFTKETLFEHIDGQADLFLQYGFRGSVFAMFRKVNAADDKIDVDIYDMGNVLQAFGVFSRFRQEEGSAGIGLDSYMDERAVFFYKGRYFVVLQATESNPSILKHLAQEIASRISDDAAPPKETSYFPRNGLKPGSIEYYPDGLLGHDFLKRGFRAAYIGKDTPPADAKDAVQSQDTGLFVAIFDNTKEAADALKLYKEHLAGKGSVNEGSSATMGPDVVTGVDPYQGKTVVAQKGPYLVGAVGFLNQGEGEQKVAELMKVVH